MILIGMFLGRGVGVRDGIIEGVGELVGVGVYRETDAEIEEVVVEEGGTMAREDLQRREDHGIRRRSLIKTCEFLSSTST